MSDRWKSLRRRAKEFITGNEYESTDDETRQSDQRDDLSLGDAADGETAATENETGDQEEIVSENSDVDDADLFGSESKDDDMFDQMDMQGDEQQSDSGGVAPELQDRVDELENEVGTLSSDVSTVERENEEIGETVETLEDQLRELMEIYEMVTRGVNPFVDESQALSGEQQVSGGEFDLFGDEQGDTADADKARDDTADTDAGEAINDELDSENGGQELFDDGPDDAGAGAVANDTANPGEDASFEDLKERFDEDDAGPDDNSGFVTDDDVDGSSAHGTDSSLPESEPTAAEKGDSQAAVARGANDPNEPLLSEMPGMFRAEQIKLEWATYLVTESDISAAGAALRYYHSIGWISAAVATEMLRYLPGIEPAQADAVTGLPSDASEWSLEDFDTGTTQLTEQHHQESLRYISAISDPDKQELLVSKRDNRGNHRGQSDTSENGLFGLGVTQHRPSQTAGGGAGRQTPGSANRQDGVGPRGQSGARSLTDSGVDTGRPGDISPPKPPVDGHDESEAGFDGEHRDRTARTESKRDNSSDERE